VSRKITYGLRRSNVDVNRAAKYNDGLFRFSFTPNLSYAANDLLLIDSLSGCIVVPPENPNVRTALALHLKETSLLKSAHTISYGLQ
jgi:hypothetical protein